MPEIVIDVNVFEHCNNQSCKFGPSSVEMCTKLLDSDLCLCIDDVFNVMESSNTSWIASEYYERIHVGMIGYPILMHLLTNRNVVQIEKSKYLKVKKSIKSKMHHHNDWVYALVAAASVGKLLVTNDYDDFNQSFRQWMKNEHSVSVLDTLEMA